MGAPPHDLIAFQRPPLNTPTLGVGIPTYDFEEDTNFQPVATADTLRSCDLDRGTESDRFVLWQAIWSLSQLLDFVVSLKQP